MATASERLLQRVQICCGFNTVDDLLAAASTDSVVPGVCKTCGQVAFECEPDATENWCEYCEENAVQSVLVIAGLV